MSEKMKRMEICKKKSVMSTKYKKWTYVKKKKCNVHKI